MTCGTPCVFIFSQKLDLFCLGLFGGNGLARLLLNEGLCTLETWEFSPYFSHSSYSRKLYLMTIIASLKIVIAMLCAGRHLSTSVSCTDVRTIWSLGQ